MRTSTGICLAVLLAFGARLGCSAVVKKDRSRRQAIEGGDGGKAKDSDVKVEVDVNGEPTFSPPPLNDTTFPTTVSPPGITIPTNTPPPTTTTTSDTTAARLPPLAILNNVPPSTITTTDDTTTTTTLPLAILNNFPPLTTTTTDDTTTTTLSPLAILSNVPLLTTTTTTLPPSSITSGDFPTSDPSSTTTTIMNDTTITSIATAPPSNSRVMSSPNPITTTSNTTPPPTTTSTISTTSPLSSTSSSIIASLGSSTTIHTNDTGRAGNIIYSIWGFLLGGMLTYLSISDTFRVPLTRAVDTWFGPRSHRRRRHTQDEGFQTYVATTFTAFTNAIDKINAISGRIEKS
ncbi:mucin-2-like [Scylla paramamosain]|uniref:mucin-2-like n=1 Tax=Scylla paramamosain TaxID=85552 RepID=UPI003082D382